MLDVLEESQVRLHTTYGARQGRSVFDYDSLSTLAQLHMTGEAIHVHVTTVQLDKLPGYTGYTISCFQFNDGRRLCPSKCP